MSILLLGNGINLQEKLAPNWEKLLQDVAKKYQFAPEKSLSMTLGYEMLENKILKKDTSLNETKIHKEIAALVETNTLKQKKEWNGTVHARLGALPISTILTTNYDYAIERSLDPFFKKAYTTRETTYSLYRYQKAGGKTIYHIHGECGYPRSICLGYEQYVGSLQRIRERIVQSTSVDNTSREQGYTFLLADIMKSLTPPPEGTWIYDFFLEDVYILGLTLDVSEMDLWWLLSYRSKQIAMKKLPIQNKIVYLDINLNPENSDEEKKHRKQLLEAFDVKFIPCKGKTYSEQYDYACTWLKKTIK